jgi:CheY-like chemotaxis protein
VARVLIVEDDVEAADALSELLQLSGHSTAVAYEPKAALTLARKRLPHVALVDMDLPVMDGIALARVLRKIPGGRTIRLVAVTGHGSSQHRAAATKAGFEAYFVKPIEPGEILEVVSRPKRPVT